MYVAPPRSEYPVTHQFVSQGKGHDNEAKEEVGHRQRGYEPVLDVLKGLLRRDGDYDQHIAHHNDDHHDGDDDGGDDDLGEGVTAGVVWHCYCGVADVVRGVVQ